MKKQLAFDLWYVFLGMFILMITEGSSLADKRDPVGFVPGLSPFSFPNWLSECNNSNECI